MLQLLKTSTGRLRIIAMLEGTSLIALVFIAVPLKYWLHISSGTQIIGPVHGALFLLFIINTLSVGVAQNWRFGTTTWKVLLACIIPFGTFYIDRKILSRLTDKPATI